LLPVTSVLSLLLLNCLPCVSGEYLQEGDDHEDEAVAAEAALVRVVHLRVEQQLLEGQDEVAQGLVGLQVLLDQLDAPQPVVLAVLDCDVNFFGGKSQRADGFDDGDGGCGNELDIGEDVWPLAHLEVEFGQDLLHACEVAALGRNQDIDVAPRHAQLCGEAAVDVHLLELSDYLQVRGYRLGYAADGIRDGDPVRFLQLEHIRDLLLVLQHLLVQRCRDDLDAEVLWRDVSD
jgi:hypothetical protein